MLEAENMSGRDTSAGQKRDGRHDTTPRAVSRNGPDYRDVRQALHDVPVQQGLQGHAAQGQGQVQPPQHTQYPPGYAHGSSGQLPYTGQSQWLSGELPQTGIGHGNMQVGSGQMFGSYGTHDPTAGYPDATHGHTYDQGWSGQLSYGASMEGLSGQLPTMRQGGTVNWCGARGGMAHGASDPGGAGGYEGGYAHAYPRTGYVPVGTPGGSGGQGRNEGGAAYGMQGNMQDGNNCSGNQQWYGNECQGYNTPGGQTGGGHVAGRGGYGYTLDPDFANPNPRMMSGPYYGGGGYGGVQMAQPANVGSDEGNYVNGGFDQGAAEARQAFPMGGFAPYQAESLQDAVDRACGTRGGVEEFFTSAQNSQTGRGTNSGQGSQDGGGRGGESEGGERKRQGARAGGSGLYTAEDHMEMERRRGEAAQRGQGLLPGRQDSQGRGGGLPKGQTVFLVDGTAVNIDDATVEMGALGTNQIPYQDLSQRQKVVRDLSVKRLRERERAGGRGRGWAPGRGAATQIHGW